MHTNRVNPLIPVSVELISLLTICVFLVSLLYSSVGHAGASGYIAVMTLFDIAPEEIRPTALALNILVAAIGTWQFYRAGHFAWSLFWPFAILSAPMAFAGGYISVPTGTFRMLVGGVLLFSAAQLVFRPPAESESRAPNKAIAACSGAGIGLLSGLTGTGGGIFLTPLLIFMRWARTKTAAGISALFILLNSSAGLAGNITSTKNIPSLIWPLMIAVGVAGFLGSYAGSRRLPELAVKRLLAAVLLVAGLKLVFA
jgi:uncharacterized membrane protein YfcA